MAAGGRRHAPAPTAQPRPSGLADAESIARTPAVGEAPCASTQDKNSKYGKVFYKILCLSVRFLAFKDNSSAKPFYKSFHLFKNFTLYLYKNFYLLKNFALSRDKFYLLKKFLYMIVRLGRAPRPPEAPDIAAQAADVPVAAGEAPGMAAQAADAPATASQPGTRLAASLTARTAYGQRTGAQASDSGLHGPNANHSPRDDVVVRAQAHSTTANDTASAPASKPAAGEAPAGASAPLSSPPPPPRRRNGRGATAATTTATRAAPTLTPSAAGCRRRRRTLRPTQDTARRSPSAPTSRSSTNSTIPSTGYRVL